MATFQSGARTSRTSRKLLTPSERHDRELADTIEVEQAKRKPRKLSAWNELPGAAAYQRGEVVHDPVYERLLASCAAESVVDREEHAARIALVVYAARGRPVQRGLAAPEEQAA